jgi:phage baseplate assembly protein W
VGTLFGRTINIASPTFAEMTDDNAIAAQAVQLILSTRHGSLWWSPESGRDLRDYVNLGLTPERLAIIPAEVRAAIEYDPRVDRADVSKAETTYTADGGAALRIPIDVYAKGAADTPIQLVAVASADLVKVITRGL